MWIFCFSKSGELGEKGRIHILQVEIRRIFDKKKKKTLMMWAPQSVWLIEECDWDLRYSRLQARRRGVPQAADSGSLPRDFQALLWYSPRRTPAARPHLLTQVHKHQLLVSCRFSCHKTPPYLIAPLKRTRCSSLQLICLVSLQLVDLICWRCIYKLKALRFRHTPCSSFNEHLFSSLLSIYFLLVGVELFSRSSKGEQELVKMSRVMSEV
jgi:hypothetical protein